MSLWLALSLCLFESLSFGFHCLSLYVSIKLESIHRLKFAPVSLSQPTKPATILSLYPASVDPAMSFSSSLSAPSVLPQISAPVNVLSLSACSPWSLLHTEHYPPASNPSGSGQSVWFSFHPVSVPMILTRARDLLQSSSSRLLCAQEIHLTTVITSVLVLTLGNAIGCPPPL